MGRHEATTSAPEDGTVLHIPSDVIEEARAKIKERIESELRTYPVRIYRAVGGVDYTWTFDRIDLINLSFGDQTGIVGERR